MILVEGQATEVQYLEEVRSRLRRKTAAVVVWHGDHTDPIGMVRQVIKLRDRQSEKARKIPTEPYSQTWVVFDREKQNDPRRAQVPEAMQLARANDVQVAVSIPAFEFWLLLHYEYRTSPFDGCVPVKKALKKFIKQYEKGALPLKDLLSRVPTAMIHAARCHAHWDAVGGDRNPSTTVDRLIRQLNDSARADVRLF